jgi:two-component system phosphoglycerate transport system response regulator PgtA
MLTKAIAIIDDELDLVNLYKEALEMNDYKVCTFTNPTDALDKLQNQLGNYALVISDYRMPVMNGNDLCTKLINLNPKLKIIIISAFQDIEYDKSKFIWLNKPILISQLLKTVKENLTE